MAADAPLSMPEQEMGVCLSELEPFAVDVADAVANRAAIVQSLAERSRNNLRETILLGMMGLLHHFVSDEYRKAKMDVRISESEFAKQYQKRYPHDPLGSTEVIEVVYAVIALSDANLSLEFK